jgi:WD repeat-containing protein 48
VFDRSAAEGRSSRRTVLTADTAGDIAAWDILACRCLGVFDRTQLSALRPAHSPRVSMSDKGRAAKELLELVRDRVEGEGTASAWATTDVRCGALSVHLDETRCFAAELYSDDADLICLTPLEAARINPGKVILRNIFDRFLATTVHNIAATRPLQPLPRHKQLPPSHISIPQLVDPLPVDLNLLTAHRKGSVTAGIALATPAATAALPPSSTDLSKRATDTSFSARRLNPAGLPGFATPAGERNGSTDYFAAAPPQDAATSPTQTKSTSKLMGKLKGLGRSGTKKGPTTDSSDADSSAPVSREPSTSTRRGDPQMDAVGEMLSQPLHIPQAGEVPVLRDFPTDLIYSISEQGQGADIWSVIYRGMASTTGTDEAQVVAFAPLWVLEYLLAGRSNTPDPLRITFLVRSWTEAPDHPALPEMPERSVS